MKTPRRLRYGRARTFGTLAVTLLLAAGVASAKAPVRLPSPGESDVAQLLAPNGVERLPTPPPLTRLPPVAAPALVSVSEEQGANAEVAPAPPKAPEPLEPIPAVVEPLTGSPASSPIVAEFSFCECCGGGCGAGGYCADCQNASRTGRFARAIYRGLCCPDPCYVPKWTPLADSAFFTSAVRPQNQQRFRWDHGENLIRPDRAEYFWARADGSGIGPSSSPVALDYDTLRHYTEVAHGPFGAWVDYSYQSLDIDGEHAAGFGDLTIGTKTLLFDTRLVQFAFQFQTHVPAGSTTRGLGVGHVSLEPGLIFGLNLTPNSYLQAEVNEWIPIGGDSYYSGALLRYNVAYNHVLARPHPCLPVVGTMEFAGWRFQDGAYTQPGGTVAVAPASGDTYLHAAAGVRLFFCDRADLGVTYATPATTDGWADKWIRSELRFRY